MEEEITNGKVGVIEMNTSSIYTENWVPVKDINNNMIILDNKKIVTGVKDSTKKYIYIGRKL